MSRDWKLMYRELSEVVKNLQVSLEQADEKLKHALNNMNHNLARAERAEAAILMNGPCDCFQHPAGPCEYEQLYDELKALEAGESAIVSKEPREQS